jgi:hypothetical protein
VEENKFEDTKRVIKIRNSEKDRQHNGQEEKQIIIYKALRRKLKIEQHEPHYISGVNSDAPNTLAVPVP